MVDICMLICGRWCFLVRRCWICLLRLWMWQMGREIRKILLCGKVKGNKFNVFLLESIVFCGLMYVYLLFLVFCVCVFFIIVLYRCLCCLLVKRLILIIWVMMVWFFFYMLNLMLIGVICFVVMVIVMKVFLFFSIRFIFLVIELKLEVLNCLV